VVINQPFNNYQVLIHYILGWLASERSKRDTIRCNEWKSEVYSTWDHFSSLSSSIT